MTFIEHPTVITTAETYQKFAGLILDFARHRDYIRGKFCVVQDDVEFTLVLSAVVYTDKKLNITDIVPVWWECETFEGQVQYRNDFQFNEVKRLCFG